MELTTGNLDAIARDCLYTADETPEGTPPEGAVIVEGIMRDFGFHPDRLESHREDVRSMLGQLDPQFMKGTVAGGWSFLQIPVRADGVQWGGQLHAEMIMVLGIGLGMVRMLVPRPMWMILPDGMPYLEVNLDGRA